MRSQFRNSNGHSAIAHGGRFLLGDALTHEAESGVVAAMERLLQLGEARATSFFTPVHGHRLHHIEVGDGRPLVMLHGACGGCANWYRLLAPLAAKRRVLALDLPGFGLSEPLDIAPPLGVNVAHVISDWLGELGVDAFDLVGTSFGSLVAVRMAQRVPTRVGKVALINGVGLGRELPMALRIAALSPVSQLAMKPSRFGTRWQFNELMTAERTRLPQAHVDALLEYLWQSANASDPRRMAAAFAHFGSFGGQREILSDDELRHIHHRLLLIWGELDRFLPVEHGRRAAALVPCALLRIIPRAGHSPNWEAPEAVLECLSPFLEGLTGSD